MRDTLTVERALERARNRQRWREMGFAGGLLTGIVATTIVVMLVQSPAPEPGEALTAEFIARLDDRLDYLVESAPTNADWDWLVERVAERVETEAAVRVSGLDEDGAGSDVNGVKP